MNIREIIESLQEDKKEHTASKAFDEGFNCGADGAIDKLRELEQEVEYMIDEETEYSRSKKVLLDVLGKDRTI